LNSLTYSQIAGIIVGMLTLGYLTDRIGRKWGSVVTASTMLVGESLYCISFCRIFVRVDLGNHLQATIWDACAGAILLTAADAPSINGLFLMFVIVQGIYGVGVGGEYPTASSAANERANSTKHLQKLRGRTVVLVFSNQGLGNLLNTLVLLILMTIFHQYGPKYNQSESLTWIFITCMTTQNVSVLYLQCLPGDSICRWRCGLPNSHFQYQITGLCRFLQGPWRLFGE
jgi:MFS family permease